MIAERAADLIRASHHEPEQGQPATGGWRSAMGAVYRHTTTEMEARILQALDLREASG
jgi:hypothetical protein